ncbi:unnamed protein product, partial [Thlaspi arvense]
YMANRWKGWLKIVYVVFAFCSAFCLGAIKGLMVGPIAGLILIVGNIAVILGLFPSHVAWTVYTLIKTNKFDAPLKVAFFFALPVLFGIWLGLSIAGSVLVGVGYGFFTPWMSAFEAFRHENEFKKFLHCIVDGTWETIKGSCTVVRDFADICNHSYPLYLKELRDSPSSNRLQPLRFIHVPGCIIVGLVGLVVEIPLYTAIALAKSPCMLFKGWQRLIHDLISREGPFLETACIPIAGLTILMWPLVERSFRRGVSYVIAMVAEFDEYTNDWLYLREGSILPKPQYRKKEFPQSTHGGNQLPPDKISSIIKEAPPMLMPSLSSSRSVREAIQEVKMFQIWENAMKSCETKGKALLDANVITPGDLYEWLRAKNSDEASIIGVGLPCYALLQTIFYSIKVGSDGLLLIDNFEINYLNRPQDRLLDWFFQPVMVLKEQIRVIELEEAEARFLEKVVLFGNNSRRMEAWENGILKVSIFQHLCRMMGMTRSISKFPTYRRRFKQIVKALIIYSKEKEGSNRSISTRSVATIEVA